jgi:hypothetical protein
MLVVNHALFFLLTSIEDRLAMQMSYLPQIERRAQVEEELFF